MTTKPNPAEETQRQERAKSEARAYALLSSLLPSGELERDGLSETPGRMARALGELIDGYNVDTSALLKTFDSNGYDELVLVRAIEFSSLCEHHVLPFTGTISVGYIPNGKIVGLSKIPRVVRALSRRLQVQERLTKEIAQAFAPLEAKGVGVVVRAYHSCAALRGVERRSEMVTSCMLGIFRSDAAARAELLELMR